MDIALLDTPRLRLRPLGAADLEAMAAGDAALLEARTGALFQAPLVAPPLFGEEIAFYAGRLRRHPGEEAWIAWLVSLRSTREAIGVGGLGGGPDRQGVFTIGYSVYPEHQGRGYATEAMKRLLAWAFAQPGARTARATIPPWNTASIRVAEKLGMTVSGRGRNDEVGEVLLFDLRASGPSASDKTPPSERGRTYQTES